MQHVACGRGIYFNHVAGRYSSSDANWESRIQKLKMRLVGYMLLCGPGAANTAAVDTTVLNHMLTTLHDVECPNLLDLADGEIPPTPYTRRS